MTALVIVGILFLILNALMLGVTALLAGMALKIYTEMAKERAMQIRANLAALGIDADAMAKPPQAGRDKIG